MIIKVGFLAAAAIVAFAASHKNCSTSTKSKYSAINTPENDDSNCQQQEIDGEMEGEEKAEVSLEELIRSNEIELLHNLEREVQQRKLSLERKLLEICGIREEQSYTAQLQRNLDDKSLEIEKLNATIASMQAERKTLQEDVKQCFLARKKLETARKVMTDLQKKMNQCNESNMKIKQRLLIVDEQVSNFPGDEDEENSVKEVEKKLKAIKNVELQVLKMQRKNKELELGKRELAVKWVSAQNRIADLSSRTESEITARVEEELINLRRSNEDLSRQVERMKNNRFDMVQELVYQRWLRTCMKFEVQSRCSSKISTPSYPSTPSPQTSTTNSSDEMFERTTMNTDSSSSSSQRSSTSKKSGFLHSIKKWGIRKGKDGLDSASLAEKYSGGKKGLARRFSTSMVPVNTSILRNKDGSSAVKSSKKLRRVSFSDSVKSTVESEAVFEEHKKICGDTNSGCSSVMNVTQNQNNEIEGETHEERAASPEITTSTAMHNSRENDRNVAQVNKTEEAAFTSGDQENKVDNVLGLVAALFFLILILISFLLHM